MDAYKIIESLKTRDGPSAVNKGMLTEAMKELYQASDAEGMKKLTDNYITWLKNFGGLELKTKFEPDSLVPGFLDELCGRVDYLSTGKYDPDGAAFLASLGGKIGECRQFYRNAVGYNPTPKE